MKRLKMQYGKSTNLSLCIEDGLRQRLSENDFYEELRNGTISTLSS